MWYLYITIKCIMDITVEQIIKLSEQKLSKREMAAIFGCSKYTIERQLHKAGIKLVNHHNSLKFDNTVFDCIDTEEKAYWLGFLYADGNISSTLNNVELSLSAQDSEHLEKFRVFLKSPNQIKISEVSVKGKKYKRCRLTVTNKYFKQQLIRLGCYPRKTTLLSLNRGIFAKPELIYPFIRGYVDGDGCISYTRTGRLEIKIMGSPLFLAEIKDIFPEFGTMTQDKRRNSCIRIICCTANKADKVLTKLYKGSTIYLERKFNRLAVLSSNW